MIARNKGPRLLSAVPSATGASINRYAVFGPVLRASVGASNADEKVPGGCATTVNIGAAVHPPRPGPAAQTPKGHGDLSRRNRDGACRGRLAPARFGHCVKSTRSRNSLPGRKYGMRLASTSTGSPVLGLRPPHRDSIASPEFTSCSDLVLRRRLGSPLPVLVAETRVFSAKR